MLLLPRFVLACICLQTSFLHPFAPARFCFSWRNCLYFFIPFAYTHKLHTMHPLLSLNFSKWSPPSTIPIDTIFLLDVIVCMLNKTPPSHLFGAFFSLFFLQPLPMGAYAPTRTILHPSAPIYVNFCLTPQNMMSGENSPAIAPKYCPEAPLIPCLALILDCPCTLSPNAPIRAHPHPFEPMYTHLYPKLHVYGVI